MALVASLLSAACSKADADGGGKTRPAPLVTVVSVPEREVPVEVHAPVDLKPLTQADVGAKTLGYLDAVLVDRGDHVKQGQTLALVRPSDLPDQLAAARGMLGQSAAQVGLARVNVDRAQRLAREGLVSQQELQQALATAASAEAAEASSKAQVGALAVKLGEMKITSPLDGVVTQRRLDPGALVGPPGGGAILTVARVDVLRVFISIGEGDAHGVAIGKEAHVEVDGLPDRTFKGQVVRLAAGFDPTTRTLDAEVHLANEAGELRPGMYGRGSIVIERHERALIVPVSAVQISNKTRYVFVIEGGKAIRREIQTGVDGGDWLEVTHGVGRGEEVVTAGADGLASGATVRVARGVDPFTGTATAPTASASVVPAREPTPAASAKP